MDEIEPLSSCCKQEARRSVSSHANVAICSKCQRLILAWDNPEDQRKTRAELQDHGVAFSEGRLGPLFVTTKERASG